MPSAVKRGGDRKGKIIMNIYEALNELDEQPEENKPYIFRKYKKLYVSDSLNDVDGTIKIYVYKNGHTDNKIVYVEPETVLDDIKNEGLFLNEGDSIDYVNAETGEILASIAR